MSEPLNFSGIMNDPWKITSVVLLSFYRESNENKLASIILFHMDLKLTLLVQLFFVTVKTERKNN